MKYDWVDKNWVPFCRHIEDHTSGSGMDYRYEWAIKGNVVRLKTFYHLMNDNGYYTGSTPVCIWFDMETSPIDFKVRCTNKNGLREYLEDLFYNAVNA